MNLSVGKIGVLVPENYLHIPWKIILLFESETEICEHAFFTHRKSIRSKFNVRKANGESMDNVESKEEAQNGRFVRTQQVAESHEAFNKIKEKSDPGIFTMILGLVLPPWTH